MLPSIKRLLHHFPHKGTELRNILTGRTDPESYPAVKDWLEKCRHRPRYIDLQMAALNAALEGHGVESLQKDGTFGTPEMQYVNMGDTYNTTIIWDDGRQAWFVESWGDWVEKAERRGLKFE